jgi:hypothetical protein
MGSVNTDVMDAQVGQVCGRARGGGWACRPSGPLRPLRDHGATPSGAVTT